MKRPVIAVKSWALITTLMLTGAAFVGSMIGEIAAAPDEPEPPEPCFNHSSVLENGDGLRTCDHPLHRMEVAHYPATGCGEDHQFLVMCICPRVVDLDGGAR